MSDFTLVSFNAHSGFQPRRNGVCLPYDLESVLCGFDADVVVVQETWWPDGEESAVDRAAAALGHQVFALPFGRGVMEPWPRWRFDGSGDGEIGLSIMSRLPARLVTSVDLGRVFADPTPRRGAIHLEIDVTGATVDLVGVHLSSRLPHGPPTQLRRLAPVLPGPGRPGVVAG